MNILKQKLEEKNWVHKYSRYSRFVQSVRTIGTNEKSVADVVIICWKDNPFLQSVFDALRNQTNGDFRLIFVNNGAGRVLDVYGEQSDIYISLAVNTGAYLARNVGALFTYSDLIIFLEDDGVPDVQLIQAHISAHQRFEDIVSIRGSYLPLTNSELNRSQNHYYLGPVPFSMYCSLEGNSSFKSSVFFQVGGWDDNILFGHGGLELSYRLLSYGYGLTQQVYLPWAILFHDFAKSKMHLTLKKEKQNHGMNYLKSKYPDIIRVRGFWRSSSVSIGTSGLFSDFCDQQMDIAKEVFHRNNHHINRYVNNKIHITEVLSYIKGVSLNVCLFGAGSYGAAISDFLIFNGIHMVKFFDSDPAKWGNKVNGILISPPSEIDVYHDAVIITSQWCEDIFNSLPVEVTKIMVFG